MSNYIIHIPDTSCADYGFDYESRRLHPCNTRALAKLLDSHPLRVVQNSRAAEALRALSAEVDVYLQPTFVPGYFRLAVSAPRVHVLEKDFDSATQNYTVLFTVSDALRTLELESTGTKEIIEHQVSVYEQAGYIVTRAHTTVCGAVIGEVRRG